MEQENGIVRRNFAESDLDRIVRFRKEGIRISFPGREFDERRFRERILRFSRKHPEQIQVLDKGGDIIGYVWFGMSDGDTGRHGVLHQIFIKEDFRNKRLAKRLLAYAEKCLASQGAKSMRMEVTETNCHAIKFYEKMRYKKTRHVMEKSL